MACALLVLPAQAQDGPKAPDAKTPDAKKDAKKPGADKPDAEPDAAPDPKDEAVKKAWEKAQRDAAIGKRIALLGADLVKSQEDAWVARAVLLVELADLGDLRAVQHLTVGLQDKNRNVSAFALHGLARLPGDKLRSAGGAPLVEALLIALKVKSLYHRPTARRLLTAIVGQDLGKSPNKWKRWLKKNKDGLKIDLPALGFDPAAFDAKRVKRVVTGLRKGGTTVPKRIPSPATEIRELNEVGLDLALALDQTSSMSRTIDAAKTGIDTLMSAIRLVVKGARVGLVTYDDAVQKTVPLSANAGPLYKTLNLLRAAGGGDIEEGVDKALGVALAGKFGWRRRTKKVVIVLGDAPPHTPDIPPLLKQIEVAHKQGVRIHAVSTGAVEVPALAQIAKAGGGRSLLLTQPEKLLAEVLVLVFGERLRPAMARFVPVLLEVLKAQYPPRRRGR